MRSGVVLPDIYNLRKISVAFRVSSDYIIGLTNEFECSYESSEIALLFNKYRQIMKNTINSEEKYYWIKVEVNDDKSYTRMVQTKFSGFDKEGREIRKPREVIPENVIKICKQLGEPIVVINRISEIGLLYLFGGNAIITETLYEEHIKI